MVQFELIKLINGCFVNSNTITHTTANIQSNAIQLKSFSALHNVDTTPVSDVEMTLKQC